MFRSPFVFLPALAMLGLACGDGIADVTGGAGAAAGSSDGASGAVGGNSGGTAGAGAGIVGGGGNGAGGGGANGGTGGIALPTEIAKCLDKTYQCGDLQDNDMDGLVDSQDPDCLGPCDDTEDSYFGGIPGQAGPVCLVDCYFDFDSGGGNDDCYWAHWCDSHANPPAYYPEPDSGVLCAEDQAKPVPVSGGAPQSCAALQAAQSQECLDYCGPLTPNGCDCFGCCELPADSGQFVWLGSEGADGNTVCTQADIQDPTKCHPCDPVPSCFNDCDDCELCIGKTELPPECDEGGGGAGGAPQDCGGDDQPCGLPGQPACPSGQYCLTGCCAKIPT